eukprot:CAMPEP_0115537012 /NCGR_PEP_ID=MMETSP0271-20121206/88092_1 /TAXON_ID=71861 /ORGANISM="Scrippsiella trochoidea, Strain CCMP3099" /LENGTH=661 /DNA_ID=CAMNT_0002969761 /DNA_START=211 /DNA_END=2193 /DNA_ORIENTATION=-
MSPQQIPAHEQPPWLQLSHHLLAAQPRFSRFHAAMCDFVAHCHQLRCAGFTELASHIPHVPQGLLNLFADLQELTRNAPSTLPPPLPMSGKECSFRGMDSVSSLSTSTGSMPNLPDAGPISRIVPQDNGQAEVPPVSWEPSARVRDALRTVETLQASSLMTMRGVSGPNRATQQNSLSRGYTLLDDESEVDEPSVEGSDQPKSKNSKIARSDSASQALLAATLVTPRARVDSSPAPQDGQAKSGSWQQQVGPPMRVESRPQESCRAPQIQHSPLDLPSSEAPQEQGTWRGSGPIGMPSPAQQRAETTLAVTPQPEVAASPWTPEVREGAAATMHPKHEDMLPWPNTGASPSAAASPMVSGKPAPSWAAAICRSTAPRSETSVKPLFAGPLWEQPPAAPCSQSSSSAQREASSGATPTQQRQQSSPAVGNADSGSSTPSVPLNPFDLPATHLQRAFAPDSQSDLRQHSRPPSCQVFDRDDSTSPAWYHQPLGQGEALQMPPQPLRSESSLANGLRSLSGTPRFFAPDEGRTPTQLSARGPSPSVRVSNSNGASSSRAARRGSAGPSIGIGSPHAEAWRKGSLPADVQGKSPVSGQARGTRAQSVDAPRAEITAEGKAPEPIGAGGYPYGAQPPVSAGNLRLQQPVAGQGARGAHDGRSPAPT